MEYSFKCKFYYETERAVRTSSVTFLLGPRRCGKTVCMKQLYDTFRSNNEFGQVIYADIKKEYKECDKTMEFIDQVVASIGNKESVLYLIDEVTYLFYPDKEIMRIQDAFTSVENNSTRVVFTGSQSRALDYWGHLAFAGDAAYVRADFLSYPEWLAYKGITEVSAETYSLFLGGTRGFYRNFRSTREYLQGCLDETVISNNKSGEIVFGNDCSMINNDMLLDVLYASLVTLHNHVSYQSFASKDALLDGVIYFFAKICRQIGREVIEDRVSELLKGRYQNFKQMSREELLQSLQFLYNCGLITITPVMDDFDCSPYYSRKLLSDFGEKPSKQEIMNGLNICIKYPMFYIDIVKDLLGEDTVDMIPHTLLGSIVECHVRGVLPDTGCFEYHDADGREIDYVNTSLSKAVEISVSNKKIAQTHFDILPGDYKKILLSKDRAETQNGVTFVPYYQFIYNHSVGKELLSEIKGLSMF